MGSNSIQENQVSNIQPSIRFVDIDETAPSRRQVYNFVAELKKNPGRWAMYCVNDKMRTAYSKAHQYKQRYPGTEWVVRRDDAGRYAVYGRHVGSAMAAQ